MNGTSSEILADSQAPSYFIQTFHKVSQIYLGTVICTGLLGNLLCLQIFSNPVLRKRSPTQYLFALALSDLSILIMVLIIWLKSFGVNWFTSAIGCQLFTYFSYVSACLSAWFIVAFTLERFIVVYYPLYKRNICTVGRARLIIGLITAASMLVNGWVLIASQVMQRAPERMDGVAASISPETPSDCSLSDNLSPEAYAILNGVDMVINFGLPAAIILILNVLIGVEISKSSRIRQAMVFDLCRAGAHHIAVGSPSLPLELRASNGHVTDHVAGQAASQPSASRDCASTAIDIDAQTTLIHPNSEATTECKTLINGVHPEGCGESKEIARYSGATIANGGSNKRDSCGVKTSKKRNRSSTASKRKYNEHRITVLLFTVSTVYLVLNLPSYVVRCINFLKNDSDSSMETTTDSGLNSVTESASPEDGSVSGAGIVDHVATLIFYSQFSVNFFLYSLQGRMYPTIFACKRKTSRAIYSIISNSLSCRPSRSSSKPRSAKTSGRGTRKPIAQQQESQRQQSEESHASQKEQTRARIAKLNEDELNGHPLAHSKTPTAV